MGFGALHYPIAYGTNGSSALQVYDGTNIWSLAYGDNFGYWLLLVKQRAADGAYIDFLGGETTLAGARYTLVANTGGTGTISALATDGLGQYLWCGYLNNNPSQSTSPPIYKVRISDGVVVATIPTPSNVLSNMMPFDGTYFWYIGAKAFPLFGQELVRFNPSNDTFTTYPYTGSFDGTAPLMYAGGALWSTNYNSGWKLRKFSLTGTTIFEIQVDGEGYGICNDGTTLYYASQTTSAIVRQRLSDGAYIGSDGSVVGSLALASYTDVNSPRGIAINNSGVWVSDTYNERIQLLQYGGPAVVATTIGVVGRPLPMTATGSITAWSSAQQWFGTPSSSIQLTPIDRLAQDALLSAVTNEVIAQMANLWANGTACPPTIEFVNQYPNHPPLSLFSV